MIVTANITAENIFSDPLNVLKGPFHFSLTGTWVATVHVQRSDDAGVSWADVESFTENGQYPGFEALNNIRYRAGVKTGNFTSGTVVVKISQ